ncbi:MAG: hypothetical protein P8O16_00740 [Algoriphagus sp.]|uniref:DinB family protein n=1 Tax=Algoriphagus sp. TaxID=1872435 RepID=UPI00262977E5|nr:hypothetical protein [Algoriphagus sp.]MDG1275775.1 hypothetical protein [Algoriphagus sp.]
MKNIILTFFLVIIGQFVYSQSAQNQIPYAQILEKTGDYTSGNILSRMIDGLGFRYYWATEGLTQADLDYIPTSESRNTMETIEHLFGLSETLLNGARSMPNIQPADFSGMNFQEFREKTLLNIQESSNLLAAMDEAEIADLKIIFQRGATRTEYPFWNMINGPITDMIHHSGQVVLLRRMSGNPIDPKVNVFLEIRGN